MKKNLTLLLVLFSLLTKAQFPFFDDFESANAFSVPSGYTATGGPNVYLVHGVGGGKAFTSPRFTFSGTATITSPNIGPLSTDAILSFKWRAATAIASVYPVSAEPLGAADFIRVEITTNNVNFTTVYTLTNSNTTPSTDFATVFVPLGSYSGQNIKVKFTISTTGHSNDFFVDLDDLAVGGTVVTCTSDVDNDGVCDQDEVAGCQDVSACNFNSAATDPGICEYALQYYNCDGSCTTDTDGDGVCNQLEIQGCQDQTACNYNPDATDNVGCVYVISLAIEGNNSPTLGDTDTYSYPNTSGSTYAWTVSNGTIVSGQGTSSIEVSWNNSGGAGSVVVTETNSIGCIGNPITLNITIQQAGIQGCTDPEACNYNPEATVNVGCVYVGVFAISGPSGNVVQGSTQQYAYPNTPGSSYTWTVTNGAITSGQGTSNISVLWNASASFGTLTVTETNSINCEGQPISFTQELATNSIAETFLTKATLYPNPTSDFIAVKGNIPNNAMVNIFSHDGRLLRSIRFAEGQPLAVSDLANGWYVLEIRNASVRLPFQVIH